jgi:hypothetical protein
VEALNKEKFTEEKFRFRAKRQDVKTALNLETMKWGVSEQRNQAAAAELSKLTGLKIEAAIIALKEKSKTNKQKAGDAAEFNRIVNEGTATQANEVREGGIKSRVDSMRKYMEGAGINPDQVDLYAFKYELGLRAPGTTKSKTSTSTSGSTAGTSGSMKVTTGNILTGTKMFADALMAGGTKGADGQPLTEAQALTMGKQQMDKMVAEYKGSGLDLATMMYLKANTPDAPAAVDPLTEEDITQMVQDVKEGVTTLAKLRKAASGREEEMAAVRQVEAQVQDMNIQPRDTKRKIYGEEDRSPLGTDGLAEPQAALQGRWQRN